MASSDLDDDTSSAASAATAEDGEGDGGSNPLTRARLTVTPYLPPPVVAAMAKFDSHPLVVANCRPLTAEPSAAILFTALVALVVLRAVNLFVNVVGGRSALHEDDEEEDDVLGGALGMGSGRKGKVDGEKAADGGAPGIGEFGDTATLCGPAGAGKTMLFRALCGCGGAADGSNSNGTTTTGKKQQQRPPPATVTSIKARAGLLRSNPSADGESVAQRKDGKIMPVRVIDYPGHPSLCARLPSVLVASERTVLVLDSTRPVTEGASVLYSALTDPAVVSAWRGKMATNNNDNKLPILIVCSKSDVPKAKNWRRMKIQLRTELQRLEKVGVVAGGAGASPSAEVDDSGSAGVSDSGSGGERLSLGKGGAGGGLDLDDLGEDVPVTLHFLSVSSCGEGEGMDALREFIESGVVTS